MDDFGRCGIFLCGEFQTTIPPLPSHRKLFREYLEERGFLDSEGRMAGDDKPPALYTIEKNSVAQNTQLSHSTAFKNAGRSFSARRRSGCGRKTAEGTGRRIPQNPQS